MLVGNHDRRASDSQLEAQLQWQTKIKATASIVRHHACSQCPCALGTVATLGIAICYKLCDTFCCRRCQDAAKSRNQSGQYHG